MKKLSKQDKIEYEKDMKEINNLLKYQKKLLDLGDKGLTTEDQEQEIECIQWDMLDLEFNFESKYELDENEQEQFNYYIIQNYHKCINEGLKQIEEFKMQKLEHYNNDDSDWDI